MNANYRTTGDLHEKNRGRKKQKERGRKKQKLCNTNQDKSAQQMDRSFRLFLSLATQRQIFSVRVVFHSRSL